MNEKCVCIIIKGKVQGVFFRKYAKRKAEEFKIKGWVKNIEDDSVYIEACGEEANLQKLIEWCHKGSPVSKVNTVEVTEISNKEFSSFDIRYS